ncbi:MAG: hypothetical protein ACP5UT_01215 [Bryobacteraceae bacterium]
MGVDQGLHARRRTRGRRDAGVLRAATAEVAAFASGRALRPAVVPRAEEALLRWEAAAEVFVAVPTETARVEATAPGEVFCFATRAALLPCAAWAGTQ